MSRAVDVMFRSIFGGGALLGVLILMVAAWLGLWWLVLVGMAEMTFGAAALLLWLEVERATDDVGG